MLSAGSFLGVSIAMVQHVPHLTQQCLWRERLLQKTDFLDLARLPQLFRIAGNIENFECRQAMLYPAAQLRPIHTRDGDICNHPIEWARMRCKQLASLY